MNPTFHSKSTVVVVSDDRERTSGVIESLVSTPGVSVKVRRLLLGGYDVGGRLLIERTTPSDLVLSVIDGRLFRQAYRLMMSHRRTCLILEGAPSYINCPENCFGRPRRNHADSRHWPSNRNPNPLGSWDSTLTRSSHNAGSGFSGQTSRGITDSTGSNRSRLHEVCFPYRSCRCSSGRPRWDRPCAL